MSQVEKLRSENVVYELFKARLSYFGQPDFGPRDYILQYKKTGHKFHKDFSPSKSKNCEFVLILKKIKSKQ